MIRGGGFKAFHYDGVKSPRLEGVVASLKLKPGAVLKTLPSYGLS